MVETTADRPPAADSAAAPVVEVAVDLAAADSCKKEITARNEP